nr:toprim domain-containing protein [Paenibacillus sp. S150]
MFEVLNLRSSPASCTRKSFINKTKQETVSLSPTIKMAALSIVLCEEVHRSDPSSKTESTRIKAIPSIFRAMITASESMYVKAPIDAMSHATLTKLNNLDWKADHRISLGCLSDNALERFLSQYSIQEIIFCLDNDHNATFRDGSPAPNWGQEAALKFARKYDELGYHTSILTPQRKDFNEDLAAIRQAEY